MGLFDTLIGSNDNISFTKEESVAAILFLTVIADGDVSAEEKEFFITTSNRMKLLRNQSGEEFNGMIDKIRTVFDKRGFDATLALAAQIVPQELKDTAFALAADLIFADGSVDNNETLLLEAIQHALGIADEMALKVVEVLQIKNKG